LLLFDVVSVEILASRSGAQAAKATIEIIVLRPLPRISEET